MLSRTIVVCSLFVCLPADSPDAWAQSWSIVALPDTQKYAESAAQIHMFNDQTQWIVDNLATQEIAFVTHEGDIVENGSKLTEWARADAAMSLLDGNLMVNPDGLVPYAAAIGNHDYFSTGNRNSGTDEYLDNFGPSRYAGRSWYVGSSANGLNHAQRFDGGGQSFLHLALEWEAEGTAADPATPLGWAKSVLDAHPSTPTIVTTHSYIWDQPGAEGRTTSPQTSGGNSGQAIFQQLIRPNPQVFMVLNGHWHRAPSGTDGEFAQTSTNFAGLPVYEMLANYQDYPDTNPGDGIDDSQGNGYLRLIEFVPEGGEGGLDQIRVKTYSPTLDAFQTDGNSEFAFDLSFADRFDVSDVPPLHVAGFQQNIAGYGGTTDTFLREASPLAPNNGAAQLNVDADDPGGTEQHVQALLKFGDLFGALPGQVPANAEIVSATLQLQVTNPGDSIELYRVVSPWNETDDWQAFDGDGTAGIQPGSEAAETPDAVTGPVGTGSLSIEVTDSLLMWQAAPDPNLANLGWAMLPTGSNGIDFFSAEGTTPPRLDVVFFPGGVPGDYDGNGLVDLADEVLWRDALGSSVMLPNDTTPGVTQEDYFVWREHYGMMEDSQMSAQAAAVPEPGTLILVLGALPFATLTWGQRRRVGSEQRACDAGDIGI